MSKGRDPLGDDAETVRMALVGLRRVFQRRDLAQAWSASHGDAPPPDYGSLRLLDAVHTCAPLPGGATVGAVGNVLGLEPSRASRVVGAGIAQGIVEGRADRRDARKVVLRLTPAGERMFKRGRQLTLARIAAVLEGWEPAQRRRFARQFERFVADLLPGPERD